MIVGLLDWLAENVPSDTSEVVVDSASLFAFDFIVSVPLLTPVEEMVIVLVPPVTVVPPLPEIVRVGDVELLAPNVVAVVVPPLIVSVPLLTAVEEIVIFLAELSAVTVVPPLPSKERATSED